MSLLGEPKAISCASFIHAGSAALASHCTGAQSCKTSADGTGIPVLDAEQRSAHLQGGIAGMLALVLACTQELSSTVCLKQLSPWENS